MPLPCPALQLWDSPLPPPRAPAAGGGGNDSAGCLPGCRRRGRNLRRARGGGTVTPTVPPQSPATFDSSRCPRGRAGPRPAREKPNSAQRACTALSSNACHFTAKRHMLACCLKRAGDGDGDATPARGSSSEPSGAGGVQVAVAPWRAAPPAPLLCHRCRVGAMNPTPPGTRVPTSSTRYSATGSTGARRASSCAAASVAFPLSARTLPPRPAGRSLARERLTAPAPAPCAALRPPLSPSPLTPRKGSLLTRGRPWSSACGVGGKPRGKGNEGGGGGAGRGRGRGTFRRRPPDPS